MTSLLVDSSNYKPAGYSELVRRYSLRVLPNWHRSLISIRGTHAVHISNDVVEEIYPLRYWPGESLGDHLEFALKYDGVNLEILSALFIALDEIEIRRYVVSKPTGKFARRIWYLYELLTSNRLPMDDMIQGNYVDVLDSEKYYTVEPARKIQRQRVNDNLPGNRSFCATIRKTEKLKQYEQVNFREKVREILSTYSIPQLKRALSYLYTKETKSSFAIEKDNPNSNRTDKFVALLQLAETEDFCSKDRLIELQNRTVDPRFQDSDYRTSQNYVGETITIGNERIHYVCPKPEDIIDLMNGLVASHERLDSSRISPVIHAAIIAYGFVFLHPFEDGNGRIHRFLIHNILARNGFFERGIMFPVSAAMLNNLAEYDQSLEAFSRHLSTLVDYTLDENGTMTVANDTVGWYRYIDMTSQAEALFWFIEKTIDTELIEELEFLAKYDETKQTIQEIIDMPDNRIDLFIRLCAQNQGRLSARKRKEVFNFLTDDEVSTMESIVRSIYK